MDHAKNVPIVVVATKKDKFMESALGEAMGKIGKDFEDNQAMFEAWNSYAEESFVERMALIESELLEISGRHFDAFVAISSSKSLFLFDTNHLSRTSCLTLPQYGGLKVREVLRHPGSTFPFLTYCKTYTAHYSNARLRGSRYY
jgi:hypothetical protein